MSLSDRILVMSNGRITGEFEGGAVDEAAIVAASAVGHAPAGPGAGMKRQRAERLCAPESARPARRACGVRLLAAAGDMGGMR